MRLYLIRHAQSANNVIFDGNDNTQGRVDDPELTALGLKQCRHLAKYVSTPGTEPRQHLFDRSITPNFDFTHLYTSLMTRAIITGEHIARACALPLQAHLDIFEHMGLYSVDENGDKTSVDGPNRAYFEERFPDLILPDSIGDTGWWSRPIESESLFLARAKRVVDWLKQTHGDTDDRVAMVVHWGFMDQLINELMGLPPSTKQLSINPWKANWVLENTSISRFDFYDGGVNAVYINRVSHLSADLL